MSSESASKRVTLVRDLGFISSTSLIIANVIGTGVFVKARVMTEQVGSAGMVLVVYLIAGLLSLAGALTYAELSTLMPRSGGEYNFLNSAFGRPWAFLFGWTRSLATGASNAALAILAVTFLNDFTGRRLPPSLIFCLPFLSIVALTLLNLGSVRSNGTVATALTTLKILLVAGLGAAAFLLAEGSWSHFTLHVSGSTDHSTGPLTVSGFGAAMLGALWSYNGWNAIAATAGEVRDPRSQPAPLLNRRHSLHHRTVPPGKRSVLLRADTR